MKKISIHQPGFMPWLGFFKKIMYSDIFVFLDNVQYVKKQWHNRNKIRTENGSKWISIPVHARFGMNINEVKIDYSKNWNDEHLELIKRCYGKSKFFETYFSKIETILSKKTSLLLDLNLDLIKLMMDTFEIKTKTVKSSELDVLTSGSTRILDICKKLDADVYLSGITGKTYVKEEDFEKSNIKIEYQNFKHPTYPQVYQPFIPNMAAIDLLFNEGNGASKVLREASNF